MSLFGKLLVIDLMPILYRGYFVFLNKPRRTASGINTSSLSLLASTLDQLIRTYEPTHMAIAMESQTPTFRHDLYAPYKAQREKMPEDIASAIGQSEELAAAWGIPTVHLDGYEADDILGTLAKRGADAGFEVIIASPDKDLGQLAGDHVSIFRPGEKAPLSAAEICEQWGLHSPEQMIDYLALAGDASDNIPGVPGIGPKTAVKLLQEYGSLENLLEHAEEIKGKSGKLLVEHHDEAVLSKKLVTIVTDVPIELPWDNLEVKPIDADKLGPVLQKYELKTIASRFGIKLAEEAPVMTAGDDLFAFADQVDAPKPAQPVTQTLATFPHTYTLADTEEKRALLLEELLKTPIIGFDTETTGLNPLVDRAVGCSFATAPGIAWYLPLPEDDEAQKEILKPFEAVFLSESIAKVGHNLKFDRKVLARLGFELKGPLHDTLLQHYLVATTDRHDMDHVSKTLLNYTPIPITRLIGENKKGNMGDLPPESILDYAAEDADVTLRLHHALQPKIEELGLKWLLEACEEPLAGVLMRMELAGVTLDTGALRKFRQELEGEILRLELAIRDYTGAGINLASPKQIGEYLFGELALDPGVKRTPRGQYPTNEEQLLKVRDRHPVVDLLLDWRACVKLKNTYVDKLPEAISSVDGRIHTTFNQSLTDTGRLSSSDPNLQNIPIRSDRGQRIRAAFVSRGPGWKLLSADYSQVELRLMAAMSQDEQMVAAFKNDEDIHTQTACAVFNLPADQITPQQRSHCKMVNFGIIYGISAFGLASRLRIPRRDAQQLIDAIFAHYPAVKTYIDKTIEEARACGYAKTLWGRRRVIPEITSRNATTRHAAERIAINMPIQGTAADIIKLAMVRIDHELRALNLKTQMILQIHDELLFDVPEEELPIVQPLVKEIMENAIELPIPLKVSIGVADDWLSAH